MRRAYHGKTHSVDTWLGALKSEAEARAADFGPLAGPVRERQRVWSRALDAIEHERQLEIEPLRCAA